MAVILDGKKAAEGIKKAIKRDIMRMRPGRSSALRLAALQIGRNPSSDIYLGAQKRLADDLGIRYGLAVLPSNASQQAAEREISRLNKDRGVTGIIIQTPAPGHIDIKRLFAHINPYKDAEGLNPVNMGNLIYGKPLVAPCTASACMRLIEETGLELYGRESVIVGHSEIVGRPLSLMLLSRMATTTVCHIGTYEKRMLKKHVGRAEILVVSVGKRNLIKGEWLRKGAVVIDVGINRYKGSVAGDVDFNSARGKASFITPVPGGVGPLTTVILMKNLVALYKNAKGIKR